MGLIAKLLRLTEVFCWTIGVLLLIFFVGTLLLDEAGRASDTASFEMIFPDEIPDKSLWSESRIRAYEAARTNPPDRVAAVLSIPEIGLKVPVYRNTSNLNLNRGVGLIEGMAALDEVGNVGIAGHRDGYFRVLKDVKIGHQLILRTAKELRRYKVSQILQVDPDRVEVLAPTNEKIITLVTCYPFYFIGPAPRRFIVKAQLEKTEF